MKKSRFARGKAQKRGALAMVGFSLVMAFGSVARAEDKAPGADQEQEKNPVAMQIDSQYDAAVEACGTQWSRWLAGQEKAYKSTYDGVRAQIADAEEAGNKAQARYLKTYLTNIGGNGGLQKMADANQKLCEDGAKAVRDINRKHLLPKAP